MMRRLQLYPPTDGERFQDHRGKSSTGSKLARSTTTSNLDHLNRTKHFVIGIAVLCTLGFACIHYFIHAVIRGRPSFMGVDTARQAEELHLTGSILMRSKDALPQKRPNNHGSNRSWKSEKVILKKLKVFIDSGDASYDTQGVGVKSIGGRNEKSSNESSILRNPREIYDLDELNSQEGSSLSQNMDEHLHELKNRNKTKSVPSALQHEHYSAVVPDAGVCVTDSNALGYRCLPSFLIIGTMKSGTGTLMKLLNAHPNLQSGTFCQNLLSFISIFLSFLFLFFFLFS